MEADPFIKGLELPLIQDKPVPIYGNRGLALIISGIGKTNAAIAATILITSHRPAHIINLGAAGATSNKFAIGDIKHINKIFEPDRPGLLSRKPKMHKPDMLEGFNLATLATHDRPILSRKDRALAGRHADLVDMEGAAVAQACRAFGIRAFFFKIVTDTAESGKMEIIKNIFQTRSLLFRFFIEKILPSIDIIQ